MKGVGPLTAWEYLRQEDFRWFGNLLRGRVESNEETVGSADKMMRAIIDGDASEAVRENALRRYAECVTTDSTVSCGRIGFFADQISFIVQKCHYGKINDNVFPDNAILELWRIPQIFKLLADDKYQELKHNIALFIVLGNRRTFDVHCLDTFAAAELILRELKGSELEVQIMQAMAKGLIWDAQNKTAAWVRRELHEKGLDPNLVTEMNFSIKGVHERQTSEPTLDGLFGDKDRQEIVAALEAISQQKILLAKDAAIEWLAEKLGELGYDPNDATRISLSIEPGDRYKRVKGPFRRLTQ